METFNVALYGPTAQWCQHVGKVCGPVKTILQTNLAGIKRLFIFYVVQFSLIVNIALIQNIQMWNALNGVWWRQTSSEYGYLTDITLVSNCLYGRVYWASHQILYQSFHGPPRNPANGRVGEPGFVSTQSFLKQNLQVIHHNTPPLGLEPCYTWLPLIRYTTVERPRNWSDLSLTAWKRQTSLHCSIYASDEGSSVNSDVILYRAWYRIIQNGIVIWPSPNPRGASTTPMIANILMHLYYRL